MKVGDYVRTKYGIRKVIQIDNETTSKIRCYVLDKFYNECKMCFSNYIYDENIIKSSPNIIDLIEENDLIEIEYKISTGENQKEIVQVIKNVNNKLFIKTYTEHYVFIEDIEKTIYKIKGIITHEQIESIEYKVKE